MDAADPRRQRVRGPVAPAGDHRCQRQAVADLGAAEDRNWDIYAMPWEDNEWGAAGAAERRCRCPTSSRTSRAAPDGTIYVVWQALDGRYSHIRMRYLQGGQMVGDPSR